jgi:hypothetical protein
MALKTSILLCLLIVPGAKPLDRGAIPAHSHDGVACKAPSESPADGRSLPRAASYDDASWSSPMLAETDEGDTEDFFQDLASVTWQSGARDRVVRVLCPAHTVPTTAHFSSRHIPLRC